MRRILISAVLAAACYAQEFEVKGTDGWLDTQIDLRAQDEITLTGTGSLTVAGQAVTPKGAKRGFRDMLKTYPVNDAGQGALIGRLGENGTARAFLIGTELKWRAPRDGRLFLGVNKAGKDAPQGSFKVTLTFTKRAPETVTKKDYNLPAVTKEVVDRYPRRIQDEQGNPGDNTNFLIVGNEKQIMSALFASGWVEVDRSHGDAVTAAVQAVLSKAAYVTLPMSELTLFGRVQDHGMAQGDPIMVVAERHHFRIWKAPFQVDGSELWVGAGTHDIGFDRDQRNNGITHKIDPEIDKERDYIGKSMEESGMVAKLEYVMPSNPSKEARTATGGTFRSDGRVLVIYMAPEESPFATPPDNPLPATEGNSIFQGLVKP